MDKMTYPNESLSADAGKLLDLIREGAAVTRPALERATGLARATVVQRLRYLTDAGIVVERKGAETGVGRPARVLQLNTDRAVTLAADVGESVIRVAATDLTPKILAECTIDFEIGTAPQKTLSEIVKVGRRLMKEIGKSERSALGIGLSLPAPVNHREGRVFGPSVMRGWDGFDICGFVGDQLGIPALADNDVNLMALAEHRRYWTQVDHFLFVKAGTGIGSGIITKGRLYRGARGASGDIGHIQFNGVGAPLCRCGKVGCVEARAAGWAIARDMSARGYVATNARDAISLLERGEAACIQRIREAGRVLGEAVADVVSVLNPTTIVIGGTLSRAGEHLLSGVREMIYARCLPLALEGLSVHPAQLGDRAGILGAAQLIIDAQLAPDALSNSLWRLPAA
jgi:predicted NBD/HSP70 family sugar kinase